MTVYAIDPTTDPRWPEFLERRPDASAFHAAGWLSALQRAYNYQPIAYTTAKPSSDLENAVPFCIINSWLTGKRLVSLPFSDHAQPLTNCGDEMTEILDHVRNDARTRGARYVELRPVQFADGLSPTEGLLGESDTYHLNMLDLRDDLETIYGKFHKNCVQRNIRKAEREGLKTFAGRSPELIKMLYSLMLLTRRRHRLPPQPLDWFQHVMDCLGDAATIRVACKEDTPVSALLSLRFKQTVVYKYGCSDDQHFNLGGIFALFWEMIRDAKAQGATMLDLGRSDKDTPGLVQFKDRWGSERLDLKYYRSPSPPSPKTTGEKAKWKLALAQKVFERLPDSALVMLGRALYRHTG